MIRNIAHLIIVVILTIITQIGGALWILVFGYYRIRKKHATLLWRFSIYILIYLLNSILVIPEIAPHFGRTALPWKATQNIAPISCIPILLNRHYVSTDLKNELINISTTFTKKYPQLNIVYLDANFPFIDGFPLLPHLSHDDGRKIDLAFVYSKNGVAQNLKPTLTGYGDFEEPKKGELNQTTNCKAKGKWQYDLTKFLGFKVRSNLIFNKEETAFLIRTLAQSRAADRIFIEPHLKERMRLSSNKIRFQGCHAVRHDDHIHFQIK